MPHPEPRSPVTLEQLLQLKRAERPDAEFWTKFDAELRQKQLAALVQHRPWWQGLPHLFARRAYLPLGAAAVLTFTLVSVRNYAPDQVAVTELDPVVPRIAAPVAPRGDSATVPVFANLETDKVKVPSIDDRTAVAPVQLSETLPPQAGELIPWSAPRTEETPSARSLAANLARLQETEPDLANALLPVRVTDAGFSMQESVTRAVELAAVAGAVSRRNRLLAQLTDRQFTQDPTAPEVVRERLARRLGDTELTGGWTRVGVKADRVSLKF